MPKEVDRCVESVKEDNPDMDESIAFAICNSRLKEEDWEDIEIAEMSKLDLESEQFTELVSELEVWEKSNEGLWVNTQDKLAVFDSSNLPSESFKGFEMFKQKGEYEGYTLGTDGDPGDEEAFKSFMDSVTDSGDAWQVRNGELFVWPEDKNSFPRHDPVIKVVGIEEEELDKSLDSYNVDFMSVTDGI